MLLLNKQGAEMHLQSTSTFIANSPTVIFLWLEPSGYFGQQSYSFATSNDIIISYNYEHINKDWFLWLLRLNNLSPTQFYWIQKFKTPFAFSYLKTKNKKEHYWDDTTFHQHVSLIISNILDKNEGNTVIIQPYSQKNGMFILLSKIRSYLPDTINNAVITGVESETWLGKFGTKACLHRYIGEPNKPSLVESVNIFNTTLIDGLTELKGYICKSKNEILIAFDKLTKQIGDNNVVLKDCDSQCGDNIFFYNNKQDIINKFVWKDSFKLITVEQDLRYSMDKEFEIDKVEFVGISFYDNKLIGNVYQLIIQNGAEFIGSKRYLNKSIEERLKQITRYDVMNKIGTKFKGGFDYAIQIFKNKNIPPKIYLMDINTGRATATAPTLMIMKKFNINKFFIRRNIKIKANANFTILLDMANSSILFNKKTKKGIYFHVFYPKEQVSVISVFEDNEIKANKLYETLQKLEFVVSDHD